MKTSVLTSVIPRCPAGCNGKLSCKLPPCSSSLKAAMEHLMPIAAERRRLEEEEEEAEEDTKCLGGFSAWETIAAARDIGFGPLVGVRQGTPGIVICNYQDGLHLVVKFDAREDGSEGVVNVLPTDLMKPLPGGFRLGQKVVACFDLVLEDGKAVAKLGAPGVVVAQGLGDHILVLFRERLDGEDGPVNVHHKMIAPDRLLVGGFRLGQKIECCRDLVVDGVVAVPFRTIGLIVGEYSDTRLTVVFETGNQSGHNHFNISPMELRGFSEAPCDVFPGEMVRARTDLISTDSVVVKAGTPGTVLACIDDTRIIVSFGGSEGTGSTRCLNLTVACDAIEKTATEQVDS